MCSYKGKVFHLSQFLFLQGITSYLRYQVKRSSGEVVLCFHKIAKVSWLRDEVTAFTHFIDIVKDIYCIYTNMYAGSSTLNMTSDVTVQLQTLA